MHPPTIFSMPDLLPADEWAECDRCAEVVPESEIKEINHECLCVECQAEEPITD